MRRFPSPHPIPRGRWRSCRGRTRRLLAGGIGALAITLVAGACDTSPVAASVNGAVIKQTALDLELRLQTSNKAYVASIDRAAAQSGNSISVTGDAPGTYSTRFVAGVLSTMIQALAIHQHLAATGQLPGPEQLAAARSVDEALFGSTWLSFPQAFRDTQVAQDAEHAAIEPAPTDTSTLRSAYQSVQKYFFSQVCVRSISVSVLNSDGTLNQGASLGQANQIVNQYNLAHSDPSLGTVLGRPSGGVVTCYDGQGLELQGAALFNQVLALAPGTAAQPQQTAYGYHITAVDSRTFQPFDAVTQKALALGIAQAQGAADPALGSVVAPAKVSVNPAYGTWDGRTGSVTAPSPLGANSSTTP
ncbi:hypothetical protein K6U06_22135 [Acidiferrimicrobium sp. IK]|uniref:hypothetical protein n=1 Tax=Acidiferrimicrobium sp. IK TaxID=2871700 RepID=UPI0021CAED71|nr:hypothetical protein [Acidiferrimicrobium sp. IK]MCU4187080.1 hypothetical protein [Acidiferrimicrobium sp. IK]